MSFTPPISVIVPVYNYAKYIRENIELLLAQDYPKYEIIAVNDASGDETYDILKSFGKKIVLINHEKNFGLSRSSNDAIKAAKYPYVALMTHDCKVKPTWLKNLAAGLTPDTDVVVGVSKYQYTSTLCRKEALIKAGLFDESYGKSGYRADTDMMFCLMDAGCKFRAAKKLDYEHQHEVPANFSEKVKYLRSRVLNHVWDPLLYKKHPERAKEMFDIRFGFLRNPVADFNTATGLWKNKKKFELSSPQGVKIIENKTLLHTLLIVFFGMGYVFLVKLARLYGSIKFGKLLI